MLFSLWKQYRRDLPERDGVKTAPLTLAAVVFVVSRKGLHMTNCFDESSLTLGQACRRIGISGEMQYRTFLSRTVIWYIAMRCFLLVHNVRDHLRYVHALVMVSGVSNHQKMQAEGLLVEVPVSFRDMRNGYVGAGTSLIACRFPKEGMKAIIKYKIQIRVKKFITVFWILQLFPIPGVNRICDALWKCAAIDSTTGKTEEIDYGYYARSDRV